MVRCDVCYAPVCICSQASVREGYAVGAVMLLAGAYGIWRLEHMQTGA